MRETERYWSPDTKLKLYRINRSRELMHSVMTTPNNTVLNTRKLLKVDRKCSHQKKKKEKETEMDMLISLIVVITSLCISDHHRVVCLKYRQFLNTFFLERVLGLRSG